MRRLLLMLTTVLVGLGAAIPAMAGESIDSGTWAGSKLSPGTRAVSSGSSIPLAVEIRRAQQDLDRTVRVDVLVTPIDGGCPVARTSSSEAMTPRTASFDLPAPCNGTYRLDASASTTLNSAVFPAQTSPTMDRVVTVAVPPPDVASVDAVEDSDRSVTVTWAPLDPSPADHLGYAVERTAADGDVTSFTVGDVTSFVDTEPPASGGETTYAVVARRPGARAGSEVTSPIPASKSLTVSPAPDTGPGGTDGTDPGGTDGVGSGTGSATGGTGGAGGRPGTAPGRPSPVIRVPRVGTPSRNFFPPLLAPPVAEDTGFSEELPFEEREPGEQDAVLPDELASGPEVAPGRGLVIPAATGLVLAVWALHLRFLARAAKPEYLDERDLPELVQW